MCQASRDSFLPSRAAASTSVSIAIGIFCCCLVTVLPAAEYRRLTVDAYRDKMAGGWIGQMAGVGWGGPTEFRWKGEIIPEDAMPRWRPEMINQFNQDDIYVEMTFLRTLELHGWDVLHPAGRDRLCQQRIPHSGTPTERVATICGRNCTTRFRASAVQQPCGRH